MMSTADEKKTLPTQRTTARMPLLEKSLDSVIDINSDSELQNSYFESSRVRAKDKKPFVFENQRINNSPYVVVRDACHLQLVKEGQNEIGFRHNRSLNMKKTLKRPSFLSMAQATNDSRFNLPERFD